MLVDRHSQSPLGKVSQDLLRRIAAEYNKKSGLIGRKPEVLSENV